MREKADLINGAAATGVLSRILRVLHHRERVELLRFIDPRIGQMDADKMVPAGLVGAVSGFSKPEIGIERGFPRNRKSDLRCRLESEASLDGQALFD